VKLLGLPYLKSIVSSNYATTAYRQPTEEVLSLSECKDAQYPVKQGRKGMSKADTS
jgi:hypothetical protein